MGEKEVLAKVASSELAAEIAKNESKISPEEIESFFVDASEIKRVKMTCHKTTMTINLGKIAKKGLDKQLQEFLEESGSSQTLTAFPESNQRLEAIYSKIRRIKKMSSIGNSDYMTIHSFNDVFSKALEEAQKEITKEKNVIEETYEECVEHFKVNAIKVIDATIDDENKKAQLLNELSRITQISKQTLLKSVCIDLEADFPIKDLKSEETKKILEESKARMVLSKFDVIISGLFYQAWNDVITYGTGITRAKGNSLKASRNTAENIHTAARKLRTDTIFLTRASRDADFKEIIQMMETLAIQEFRDVAEIEVLATLARIKQLAKGYGVEMVLGPKTQGKGLIPSWINEDSIELYA